MSRKIKVASTIAVTMLIGFLLFGWSSTIEWDSRSGMQRTVHHLFGLRVVEGSRQANTRSDWRGASADTAQWVQVAATPKDGALATFCYERILGQLKLLDWQVRGEDQRRQCATWILDEVATGTPICDLSRRCQRFGDSVRGLDHDFEQGELSVEVLRTQWEQTKKAQQVAAGQPATTPRVGD